MQESQKDTTQANPPLDCASTPEVTVQPLPKGKNRATQAEKDKPPKIDPPDQPSSAKHTRKQEWITVGKRKKPAPVTQPMRTRSQTTSRNNTCPTNASLTVKR